MCDYQARQANIGGFNQGTCCGKAAVFPKSGKGQYSKPQTSL